MTVQKLFLLKRLVVKRQKNFPKSKLFVFYLLTDLEVIFVNKIV